MRTKLYLASTKALRDEARFARLLETVPDQRREKVLAFRPDSARRLSLGAGLLLKLALAAEGLQSAILMQVHDELVLQVPDAELPWVRQHVPQLMASVATLRVPLIAELGEGANWAQAH